MLYDLEPRALHLSNGAYLRLETNSGTQHMVLCATIARLIMAMAQTRDGATEDERVIVDVRGRGWLNVVGRVARARTSGQCGRDG